MIPDSGFCSMATVFGRRRRRQMPFHIGSSGDQRHVVQVNDLVLPDESRYLPLQRTIKLPSAAGRIWAAKNFSIYALELLISLI